VESVGVVEDELADGVVELVVEVESVEVGCELEAGWDEVESEGVVEVLELVDD
jgi:hypothetical protein